MMVLVYDYDALLALWISLFHEIQVREQQRQRQSSVFGVNITFSMLKQTDLSTNLLIRPATVLPCSSLLLRTSSVERELCRSSEPNHNKHAKLTQHKNIVYTMGAAILFHNSQNGHLCACTTEFN